MLTTRAAHTLLSETHTEQGVLALVRALGFSATPHTVSARARAAMGFTGTASTSRVSRITRDEGAALLLIEQCDPDQWRAALHRVTAHLDRLTDPRRWLLLLQCAHGGPLVIASWLSSPSGPRMAVLTTAPTQVLDSDAQTVAALAAAWHTDPTLTCVRWHELLGRHAIGKRFFRALEKDVTAIADAWPARVDRDDRRTLALIHVARLLFLKFLETKGWLDHDRAFVSRHADATLGSGGGLWRRLVAPLTFGTLNTPYRHRAATARAFGRVPFLNGGLFACSAIETRARHPALHDEQLAPLLLDTLARFRFTAREEATSWSEAAIDPDLLGRTFEALMDTDVRRGTGTFYTPAALISTLVDDALAHALSVPPQCVRAALSQHPIAPADAAQLLAALDSFRVIDPACGSGGLLVATLERTAGLRQWLGDSRNIATIRRETLTRSIFGLDIAPMAVWLCELRLWLSVVIDDPATDPHQIVALPNLDHNIRLGDALSPNGFDDVRGWTTNRITALRERYAQSTGARKRSACAQLDGLERAHAASLADRAIAAIQRERADLLRTARDRSLFGARHGLTAAQRRRITVLRAYLLQLRRTRRRLADGGAVDFDFRTHFGDAAARGGFDLVIGNPPWVRPHHLDATTREQLRTRFARVTRHVTAHTAFGVQADIAIPFTLRGLELCKPDGVLAFLVPAKLWRSVSGGALREHLLQHATPAILRDHSANAGGFTAAVYPSAIVLRRTPPSTSVPTVPGDDLECHTTNARGETQRFTVPLAALPASSQPGAPWRIIPAHVRAAADALSDAGHRWADSVLPSPSLGVKTGLNDAFLLTATSVTHELLPYTRPALRGESVRAWHTPDSGTAIVLPCDADGRTLRRLPAPLARYFAPHERRLLARTDLRPKEPWWTLFRTELLAADSWRVVWADIGRTLRATVLPPHSSAVPLNSCYGVRFDDPVDAHTLAALLNAPTTTAWLSLVAEPARGGYHRFMAWTVVALPLPDWPRARQLLAPIAARARRGDAVDIAELHRATLDTYQIQHSDVAPLLEWASVDLRSAREQRAASI